MTSAYRMGFESYTDGANMSDAICPLPRGSAGGKLAADRVDWFSGWFDAYFENLFTVRLKGKYGRWVDG